MPTVQKTHGGEVYLRSEDARVTQGDRVEVSAAKAAYLCDERGDFERVGDEPGPEAEDDGDGDGDGAEPPLDPGEYTIAELEEALAEGDYSGDELTAITAAEAAGEDRKGAHDTIDAARE